MSKRKHISWKTKCAAALLHIVRDVAYDDAKKMTKDQFLSLWHFDHNILHSSEHEDRDEFWNLTPMFIKAHRTKTKADAKIIAKSKRIRAKKTNVQVYIPAGSGGGPFISEPFEMELSTKPFTIDLTKDRGMKMKPMRKMKSRGFDKTKTKGFDGKVRDRK